MIFHFAVVHKQNLYVFGGYNGLLDLHFDDLYKYDPGKLMFAWNLRFHGFVFDTVISCTYNTSWDYFSTLKKRVSL